MRVARDYLKEPLSQNKSSRVIFGSQNNDLKSLASQGNFLLFSCIKIYQGWSVETPVEGLEASQE